MGILVHFQAFLYLRVFPAPNQNPRPPTRRQGKPLRTSPKFDLGESYNIGSLALLLGSQEYLQILRNIKPIAPRLGIGL